MKRTITWIAAAALLTLGGCNKKSENPPPAPTASTPTTPAAGSGMAGSAAGSAMAGSAAGSAMAGSGSAAAALDVPTEEDFESDAASKINDKNVEAQVQALEKQLGPEAK